MYAPYNRVQGIPRGRDCKQHAAGGRVQGADIHTPGAEHPVPTDPAELLVNRGLLCVNLRDKMDIKCGLLLFQITDIYGGFKIIIEVDTVYLGLIVVYGKDRYRTV